MRCCYHLCGVRAAVWVQVVIVSVLVGQLHAGDYDPLVVPSEDVVETIDLSVTYDLARPREKNRQVPIRVYLPTANRPAPVILFSHGLGGHREETSFLPSIGRGAATSRCFCSIQAVIVRSGRASSHARPGARCDRRLRRGTLRGALPMWQLF